MLNIPLVKKPSDLTRRVVCMLNIPVTRASLHAQELNQPISLKNVSWGATAQLVGARPVAAQTAYSDFKS